MENIVRISEIQDVVNRTLLGIREGVASARQAGLMAELPDKVDFQMVVIDKWQELEAVSEQDTTGQESQGGSTTETTRGTEQGSQNRVSDETRRTEEDSTRTSERTSEDRTVSDQSENSNAMDGGYSTTTGTGTTSDRSASDNAHRQRTETTEDYAE